MRDPLTAAISSNTSVGLCEAFGPKSDLPKPVRFAPMTRSGTPLEAAAGKLIAAIQKEWDAEIGETESGVSEKVMHEAHALLQAASKFGSITNVIGSGSVSTYPGEPCLRPARSKLRLFAHLLTCSRIY